MKNYLIVETQSPFQSGNPLCGLRGMELALELTTHGAHVKLWLMQDAVQIFQLQAVESRLHALLTECLNEQLITVYVDQFAVTQRGCSESRSQNVNIADMSLFTEQLMIADTTAIWH